MSWNTLLQASVLELMGLILEQSYIRQGTLYSGLAKAYVFVAPDDGAEKAGNECEQGMPASSVGGPVNVMTGNMWLEQTDYRIAGFRRDVGLKSLLQHDNPDGRVVWERMANVV